MLVTLSGIVMLVRLSQPENAALKILVTPSGIVMLVKPKTAFSDGEIFIAVGYGLEGAIPDAYVKRIIEEVIIPHFRYGDYFEGVSAGCDVLMKLAGGEISELREDDEEEGLIAGIIAITIICILAFVIVLIHENGKGGGHGGNSGSGGRRAIHTGPIIIGRPSGGSFGSFTPPRGKPSGTK